MLEMKVVMFEDAEADIIWCGVEVRPEYPG